MVPVRSDVRCGPPSGLIAQPRETLFLAKHFENIEDSWRDDAPG